MPGEPSAEKTGMLAVGPLSMLGAASLFAIFDGLVKLLDPSFRVWDIVFYRSGLSLIVLVIILGLWKNPFLGNNKRLLVLRGVFGSMALLALIVSIRRINISAAMVIFFSFPAFAAVFSHIIFDQKITREGILYILLTLCGVAVFFDFNPSGGDLFGHLLAVVAAVCSGLSISIIRKLRETDNPFTIYLYFCTIAMVAAFPFFIINPHVPEHAIDYIFLAGITAAGLGGHALLSCGLRYCKSWEGGIYMTSEVILTSVFGIILLKEMVTWRFWLGGFLICCSVIGLNLSRRHRSESSRA